MGNNKSTSNDILVKVDHNNLIYIDPNTVVSDGMLQQRQIEPENLVVYVNLEADLVPRTTLINGNESSELFSIAKGTLNFLQHKDGQNYDSTWTDAFTNISEQVDEKTKKGTGSFKYEGGSQTFGIDNISIKIAGTNFVPQIQIKFVDVRGKTLFESPENSPYKAFFHLPWPIFYLTVKGYYGKAIRYRLHMVSFKSSYNSANGNFEVDTVFVGSVYAFLTDIPLTGILNAPYMYGIERTSGTTFNSKTGFYEKELKKTSIGYVTLKSVYDEYKSKGLLPKDFPYKTLREIAVIARRLNKILEEQIFNEVIDPKILSGVREFDDLIQNFRKSADVWKKRNLSSVILTINGAPYYELSDINKNSDANIKGKTPGTLEQIILNTIESAKNNQAFGQNRDEKLLKKENLKIVPISFDDFKDITKFYKNVGDRFVVDYDKLTSMIDDVSKNYKEQRTKLEEDLQKEMNVIVKNSDGFGFEPTIRNIFGVVLANADVYIRLLKEVHRKAFVESENRQEKLKGILTDSVGKDIYPWPEVKEKSVGKKQNVLAYPGSKNLIAKLGSNNRSLWPEVGFVEEFMAVATYKVDHLSEKEDGMEFLTFVFESDSEEINKNELTTFTKLTNVTPYYNKTLSSILYEIWERARMATALESFNSGTIQELAKLEFENLKSAIQDDYGAVEILKTKVNTPRDLQELMYSYSPFERWPYYKSQVPTVSYITSSLSNGFELKKYVNNEKTIGFGDKYVKLNDNLKTYIPEGYRHNVYPFNSDVYKSYLSPEMSTREGLNLNGILQLRTNDGFISSPEDGITWVKENYKDNLFGNLLTIGGTRKHILNTPYFHKQLYNDFITPKVTGKYASSAYLLLNSLPFKDLDDTIKFENKDVLVSTIFREIGATHYIPYHLMLKWGSIYHRYKMNILEGEDIISDITSPIDTELFFDNNLDRNYTVDGVTVNRTFENNVGLYPFYQSVFHQIAQGYAFYNPITTINPTPTPTPTPSNITPTPTSSATPTPTPSITQTSTITNSNTITSTPTPLPSLTGPDDYSQKLALEAIIDYNQILVGGKGWTTFIDNSKFDSETSGYTILPCNGYYDYNNINDFIPSEQDNFRLLWGIEEDNKNILVYHKNIVTYTGETFPSSGQYFKNLDNVYTLSENNKKVLDLIATFKPDILDAFEQAFIEFSSEKIKSQILYAPYAVKYYNFQDMLKDMVYIPKTSLKTTNSKTDLINQLTKKQIQSLKDISNNITSTDSLIKLTLSNPKEIDPYHLFGFTEIDSENYDVGEFFTPQVTQENLNFIKLYLGEDIESYYLEFFSVNNIALTEENIKNLRFLIYVYAGARKGGLIVNSRSSYVTYLKNNVINKSSVANVIGGIVESSSGGMAERMSNFLNTLIGRFKELVVSDTEETISINNGYNDDPIKIELYNYFKSFNDKWVAGNSLGQRSLMEEFLFLDKANRDIGDDVYLSMDRITSLLDQEDLNKTSLFTALNLLIKNTGFDIRPLPAYINFYGANDSNTKKITPSKNVAKNLFGSFLEVDYLESSPKVILQYVGPTSKYLEMSDIDRDVKFKNDTFDMSNVNNNPLIIEPDVFRDADYSKSNKVVAFEVSFGDQNQSIFKGLELSQDSIRNTSESFQVLENLGNQESGSSTAQVDIGLFDIYRTASYACTVMCMGNVMIQPTMYFYLKNVPLFRGSYWITEVNHTIRNNGIETSFTGTRIPLQSLPDPEDSFLASYRSLFDILVRRAATRVHESDLKSKQLSEFDKTFTDADNHMHTYNHGGKEIGTYGDETLAIEAGITEYGLAYNGFGGEKYTQLIRYTNNNITEEWLRTTVVEMGGRENYITDDSMMTFITKYKKPINNEQQRVNWVDIKNTSDTEYFYGSKFIFNTIDPNGINQRFNKTKFFNPKTKDSLTINSIIDHANNKFVGPVEVGPGDPNEPGQPGVNGIIMSRKLMRDLNLQDNDVIYFRLTP